MIHNWMILIIDNYSDRRYSNTKNSSSSRPISSTINSLQSKNTKKRKNQSLSPSEPLPKRRKSVLESRDLYIYNFPVYNGKSGVHELTPQQRNALFGDQPEQYTLFMCRNLNEGISILTNEQQSKCNCFVVNNQSFNSIKFASYWPEFNYYRLKQNVFVKENDFKSFINSISSSNNNLGFSPSRFIIEDIVLFTKINHLLVHHVHLPFIIIASNPSIDMLDLRVLTSPSTPSSSSSSLIVKGSRAITLRRNSNLEDCNGNAGVFDKLTQEQRIALFSNNPETYTTLECRNFNQVISLVINEKKDLKKQGNANIFIVTNNSFGGIESNFDLYPFHYIQPICSYSIPCQNETKQNVFVKEEDIQSFIVAISLNNKKKILNPSRFIIESIGLFNKIKHLFVHYQYVQFIMIHLNKDINMLRVLAETSPFAANHQLTIPPINYQPSLV